MLICPSSVAVNASRVVTGSVLAEPMDQLGVPRLTMLLVHVSSP